MVANWKFFKALVAINMSSALNLRVSFLFQMIFMAFNNLVFFTVWWIFFGKFEEVNGWRLPDLEAMYGFASGAYGLAVVFGGGVTDIARKIISGELDSYLVQPKSVLLQLLCSHSRASGWGDIVTALILLGMSGYVNWITAPLILLLLVIAAVVFLGAGVIAQSLSFWFGPMEHLARQMFEFVITFSVYPQTIFPMLFKIFLFTIIPAGFIGFLPVELLRDFRWSLFGVGLGGAIAYIAFSIWFFHRGLQRYES